MECGLTTALAIFIFVSVFIKDDVLCQKVDEMGEMKYMLRSALEQNRKLEQQNNRLKLIWSGLEKMCGALQISPCDCSVKIDTVQQMGQCSSSLIRIDGLLQYAIAHYNKNKTISDTNVTLATPVQDDEPLRVLAVTSSGLVDDTVNVSIDYRAPTTHSSEWLIRRYNGGIMRTGGTRTIQESRAGGNKFAYYRSSITITDYNQTHLSLVRVYTENEIISITFNLTAVEDAGTQPIDEIKSRLSQLNSTYIAPSDSDLNITIIFKKDLHQNEILAGADVYFIGLNTSVNPPVFAIPSYKSEVLVSSSSRNSSTVMQISLRYRYVQYGGILTFLLPHRLDGYAKRFYSGNIIKIMSPLTHEVVPYNQVGVFNWRQHTLIMPPSQRLTCTAMGNPRPEVYILKVSSDGTPMEMATETLILDSVYNIQTLNLYTEDPGNASGNYICRAVSGNKTVDTMTEAIIPQPITFDELRSGVTKNTTKKIVISCRASGRPRPHLQMRLRDKYGPDLMKYGVYKVSRKEPNRTTTRITVTLPANETRVDKVFCVASYELVRINKFMEIDVFPGAANSSLEFYDTVVQAVNSVVSIRTK